LKLVKKFISSFLILFLFPENLSYCIKKAEEMSDQEIKEEIALEKTKFEQRGSIFEIWNPESVDLKLAYINIARLNELFDKYSFVQRFLLMSVNRFIIEFSEGNLERIATCYLNVEKHYGYIYFRREYFKSYEERRNGDLSGKRTNFHCDYDEERVLEATSTHEFGHLLGSVIYYKYRSLNNFGSAYTANYFYSDLKRELCDIARKKDRENFTAWISNYGEKNDTEWFAELFTSYEANNKTLLTSALHDWMSKNNFLN